MTLRVFYNISQSHPCDIFGNDSFVLGHICINFPSSHYMDPASLLRRPSGIRERQREEIKQEENQIWRFQVVF